AEPLVAAVIDIGFLPLAAFLLYQVLKKAPSKRNLVMVALLGLLALANASFHASVLGWSDLPTITSIHAALLIIVVIETIIGGRVVPLFTKNVIQRGELGLPACNAKLVAACAVAAWLSWITQPAPVLVAVLALASALGQAVRIVSWRPRPVLHTPLLCTLHLYSAWLPIGFLLPALS